MAKTLSIILKIPLVLFVLASFGGAVYAAAYKIQNINWVTPVIMGILIFLYVIGWSLGRKKEDESDEIQENTGENYTPDTTNY